MGVVVVVGVVLHVVEAGVPAESVVEDAIAAVFHVMGGVVVRTTGANDTRRANGRLPTVVVVVVWDGGVMFVVNDA